MSVNARQRFGSTESGAILPIVALLLILLMGFAAIGVDLSAAYAETRQSQSAADAAVMAGALAYLDSSAPTGEEVAAFVKSYAAANAPGTPLTDGDWTSCDDSDRPNDYHPLEDDDGNVISPCISLKQVNDAPALLRVRMPDWAMPTSFAALLGFDTLNISRTATAELKYQASRPILPFSLPANHGLEECLATPPSGLLPGDAAPCNGPAQGNFGLIDSPWFGAPAPEFTDEQACPSDPNFNTRAPHNLAYGLDHLITTWASSDPIPDDGVWVGNNHAGADSCANAQTPTPPYALLTQPGDTQSAGGKALLQNGFLGDDPSTTSGNLPGRLRQPSSIPSPTFLPTGLAAPAPLTLDTSTWDPVVDNIGLWEYLIDGTGPCASQQFLGKAGRELTLQLEACLASGSPQFSSAILDSPRFATVPVLNYESGAQFGNKWWAVKALKPVYLHSTWYECTNGSDKECLFQPEDFNSDPSDRDTYSILFNPGEGADGPCYLSGSTCSRPLTPRFQLMGVSAFVLEWGQIPGSGNQFGSDAPFEVFLHPNE